MPKEEDKLESIDRTLREILKWTRFANISKLKETLQAELDSDEKKLAYDSTDDSKGIEEVASVSGAPRDTVYGWWQKWFRLGLVTESETRKGRMVKIVSLDDVGIKTPRRATRAPQSEAAQPSATEERT